MQNGKIDQCALSTNEDDSSKKTRIMLVDDEESFLKVLQSVLEIIGYRVTMCLNAFDAIEELRREVYELVVTDLKMPGLSGVEFVKKVKQISPNAYIVVMTGFPSVETAVRCMKLGASDYLVKPFDMEFFQIIVERTLYKRTLEKRAAERDYYEQISRTDGLTGLYNHRFFYKLLDSEISRAGRYKHNFSLLMIDIDDFKRFNDQYGHQIGDRVLKELASLLKKLVRKIDPVVRYGGEEFAIILSETAKGQGRIFGKRVVDSVGSYSVQGLPESEKITVSAGLAGYPDDAHTQEELVRKADAALYEAKGMGKNTLCVYAGE
ncbi:MAG: diguanylate cyclase [Planctomycetes bacterium]|nr:diguanylate cyclase [Planctomycetota bacterium]